MTDLVFVDTIAVSAPVLNTVASREKLHLPR